MYQASSMASFNKGQVSEFGMKLFLNGIGKDQCYSHFETSAILGATPSFVCLLRLSVGDKIYVAVDDHVNPVNDPTLTNFNLNLVRIGE
jgi:hypothetical protein